MALEAPNNTYLTVVQVVYNLPHLYNIFIKQFSYQLLQFL